MAKDKIIGYYSISADKIRADIENKRPFENNIIKILHYYYSFVNRNKAQYLQNLFLCKKSLLNMYFLNKIERKWINNKR